MLLRSPIATTDRGGSQQSGLDDVLIGYICSSHPATCRVVQQRFALLWGPGAYDVYNAEMQKK